MHGTEDRLAATDRELARMLGVSARHVWNLDAQGKIGPRPIKLGKSRRWALDEVRAWLAAGAPDRATWDAAKAKGGGR